MSDSWPLIPLGEVLIERKEIPDFFALESGEVRIVSKIGFDTGQIELRSNGKTKTKMILIQPGDLVLSGINAAKGAIAVYPDEEENPISATIHYGAYEVKKDKADKRFLWWLLRSNTFRKILLENLPGGIKTELKAKRLLPIKIPFPPLSAQRRIAAKIEQLAAKIEKAKEIKKLAALAEDAILHSMFRRVFTGKRTWDHVELEEVCLNVIDCLHSNPVYSETGIPTIRSPDVGWGELFLKSARKTSEEEYNCRTRRGEPKPGDIIIVREGGGTGKAGIAQKGIKFSLGQRVMQLRPDKGKVLPLFLLYQWLSPQIQQDQIAQQTKGSASPHLNIKSLKKFRFILPPMQEQYSILSKLESLHRKLSGIKTFQAQIAAKLNALLPSILDKAFKGEL